MSLGAGLILAIIPLAVGSAAVFMAWSCRRGDLGLEAYQSAMPEAEAIYAEHGPAGTIKPWHDPMAIEEAKADAKAFSDACQAAFDAEQIDELGLTALADVAFAHGHNMEKLDNLLFGPT